MANRALLTLFTQAAAEAAGSSANTSKGDVVRCYTGGGGGYGNPLERDPQAVLDDLADGHISPDYAQQHHRLKCQEASATSQVAEDAVSVA